MPFFLPGHFSSWHVGRPGSKQAFLDHRAGANHGVGNDCFVDLGMRSFLSNLVLRKFGLPVTCLSVWILGGCTHPVPEGEARITFGLWGTHEQERGWQVVIDEFRRLNPDIRVTVLPMGYGRYFQKMQAMMVGNVAPDVFMIGVAYYDEWLSRGVLSDLTREYHQLLNQGEMMPLPRLAVERNDRVFGLPLNVTGVVTCVNLDALAAAGIEVPEQGWTWKEMLDMAPRLSARRGDPNAPTDYAMVLPHSVIFFWQAGIDLFDDPHYPTRVTINTPKAVEVLDALRQLYASGFAAPPEVGMDQGYRELFRDGRVAFYFDSLIGTLMFYDRTQFDWDIRPFPRGEVSNVSYMGSVTVGVWSGSGEPAAARKLAQFLASPYAARVAMKNQRFLPAYREIAFGEEFLAMQPPPSMHHFASMMEEEAARTFIYGPGLEQVNRIFLDRISQAFSVPQIHSATIISGLEDDLIRWLQRMRRRGFYVMSPESDRYGMANHPENTTGEMPDGKLPTPGFWGGPAEKGERVPVPRVMRREEIQN